MSSALIFDIDGTLWDATETVARGCTEGLRSLGILDRTLTQADIRSVCGLPVHECMSKLFPDLSGSELLKHGEALDHFERVFVEKMGGDIYSNAVETVEALSKKYELFLLSNCQDWYLNAFLKQSGLTPALRDFTCYGSTQKPKSENLKTFREKYRLTNMTYIGDTKGDLESSRLADCKFVYASYGFGKLSDQELKGSLKINSIKEMLNHFG